MPKRVDITGKQFNYWNVIKYIGSQHYECKCTLCNNIYNVNSYKLTHNMSKCCSKCAVSMRKKLYEYSYDNSYTNTEIICINDIKELLNKNKIKYTDKEDNDSNSCDFILEDYNIDLSFVLSVDNVQNKMQLQNKYIFLKNKGIRLINIFEYEWINRERHNKLVEFILLNTIRTNTTKIYARNTNIITLDNHNTKEFLNSNHFQLYSPAEYNIGLEYNNELVALMTFGKPRFSCEYEYELIRLAFKSNIIIIGGTERMFKYFIKEIKPTSIISYCAITKFSGNIYKKLGFTSDGLSSPNYRWINTKTNENYARYQCMKHKLIKNGLGTINETENDIMRKHGFIKIYDCGNEIYTLQLDY